MHHLSAIQYKAARLEACYVQEKSFNGMVMKNGCVSYLINHSKKQYMLP